MREPAASPGVEPGIESNPGRIAERTDSKLSGSASNPEYQSTGSKPRSAQLTTTTPMVMLAAIGTLLGHQHSAISHPSYDLRFMESVANTLHQGERSSALTHTMTFGETGDKGFSM